MQRKAISGFNVLFDLSRTEAPETGPEEDGKLVFLKLRKLKSTLNSWMESAGFLTLAPAPSVKDPVRLRGIRAYGIALEEEDCIH